MLRVDPLTQHYTDLAELAGGFIHDVKNHLGTFSLNLQLLAEDFAEPQNQKERRALERVKRLQSECNRLVDISNDFLRFARIQELDLQPTAIEDIVNELIDFLSPTAKASNINLSWYPSAMLPVIPLDRELFRQALLNVLLNAEQAMPNGGNITLQAHPLNNGVLLDVIETGCGMTEEQRQKAFKPFHTTKPNGNGLGLATTRKVILAHGGKIDLQSELGRGTKVSIWLPVQRALGQ